MDFGEVGVKIGVEGCVHRLEGLFRVAYTVLNAPNASGYHPNHPSVGYIDDSDHFVSAQPSGHTASRINIAFRVLPRIYAQQRSTHSKGLAQL